MQRGLLTLRHRGRAVGVHGWVYHVIHADIATLAIERRLGAALLHGLGQRLLHITLDFNEVIILCGVIEPVHGGS